MSNALAELKQQAAQLSEIERAELALAMIQSLDGGGDADVETAWQVEIERRIKQVERGEIQLIPGEKVFARLRQKLA
jgi:putative addiction module component (TIGR02574 family)